MRMVLGVRVVSLVATAALLSAILPGPALAQAPPRRAAPAPASPEVLKEAARRFQLGVTLYNDGNARGALVEFEASYGAHPSPSVLYNLGLTLKALHRYAEAIDRFQSYLATAPRIQPERRVAVERLIADMRALLGELRIEGPPPGAQVLVDGRKAGTAPLPPLQLASGAYVIEVIAEGHRPLRREITLTAGAPLTITLRPEPVPRTGRLQIQSTPSSAEVRLDGRSLGTGSVQADLAPGKYQVEVVATGHVTYRNEIDIVAGQERTLSATLDRARRPFYKTWWFWTTVGAVVVGATVGGILGSRGQAEVPGSLPPGVQHIPAPGSSSTP